MGIFQRTSGILAANVNDVIDRLEQPDKMLRQAVRYLEAAIGSVQVALARSIAWQRLLTKQRDEQQTALDRWHNRATAAVLRGDDDLARRALNQRVDAERSRSQLESQIAEAEQTVELLRARSRALRAAQADARHRLAAWEARRAALAARRDVWPCGDFDGESVLVRIDYYSRRLDLAEAEALALGELHSFVVAEPADEFVDRERHDAIEAELEWLKSEPRM